MNDYGKKMTLRVFMMLGLIVGINKVDAWAIGDVKVKPVEGSKKAVVAIDNNQAEDVKVSVSSESGYTSYYNEAISGKNSYAKVYDLKEFEDGSYKIVVDDEFETLEKVIYISGDALEVEKEVKFMKPKFKATSELLYVSFSNLHGEDVKISIFDGSQKLHSEEIKDAELISKKFDITKLDRGEYSVQFTTDSKTYFYSFKK